MEITERELDFLRRIQAGRHFRIADREEDRARQKVRKAGIAEVVMNPRRWVLTPAGIAALQVEEDQHETQ